ncbi:MAG TPA: FAD-binding oxidoreductase [Candidatus Nanopelagicales bacterium]
MSPADPRGLSLWWDSLGAPPPPRAALDGDLDVDVAIVGAGYTGLWTAHALSMAAPGTRIAVLEAEVAGFGASGRNGGWCSALFPASMEAIARRSSRAAALAMQHAMHDTVDEVGRTAAVEGLAIDWAKGGTVTLARTPVQLARLRAQVEHWRSWGFGADDYRLLDAAEASARVGASDVLGALVTPHCAAIQPAKLVRGLAEALERRGVRVYEHSPATSIEPGVVRTPRGDVRAPYVVRATEAFTARLRGHRRTLMPVYSLMLATEPLPADVWDAVGLAQRETFNDARHLIIYGQRTADDRLAFGGRGAPYHFGSRIEPHFDRVPAVHEALWRTLVELFPTVAPYRVTHRWGGPLGIPRDWYASCGLDRRTGLAWAGGYVGDGVGTSNLAGRTLADLIVGRRTELTTLPWVQHRSRRWEPEPVRWFGANGGLAVMSSADAAEARTGRPARRAELFGRFLGH